MGGSMNIDKLTVKVSLALSAHKDMGASGFGDPAFEQVLQVVKTLADGRGANYADLGIMGQSTIAARGNLDLELQGGTSPLTFAGDVVNFSLVKGILVYNADTADSIRVGGRPANAFEGWVSTAGHVVVGPLGCFFIYRPDATAYPVASGDVLRLHNDSDATLNVKWAIIGEETDASSASSSSISSSSSSASASTASSSSSVSASASSVSASTASSASTDSSSITASLSSASTVSASSITASLSSVSSSTS